MKSEKFIKDLEVLNQSLTNTIIKELDGRSKNIRDFNLVYKTINGKLDDYIDTIHWDGTYVLINAANKNNYNISLKNDISIPLKISILEVIEELNYGKIMDTVKGRYITLKRSDKGLIIELTEDGREELTELLSKRELNTVGIWVTLMEDIQGNSSYDFLLPEQTGDLTDAPIIGYDYEYEDDGQIIETETSTRWWLADYQVIDEFEILLRDNLIMFQEA